jgi:hypothetical protein
MSFDINTFATNIASYGYSSANKFDVQFSLPNFILNNNGQQSNLQTLPKLLQLRASNVVLPAVLLMSQEINRYGMGPVTTQPYNAKVSDVPMTFILDQNDIIYLFFYDWINYVYNFTETAQNSGPINYTDIIAAGSVSQPNYTTNYEDDVISETVTITHYDQKGSTIKSVNLYRVKPTLLSAIPLKWDDNDSLMKLTVNFTYREWARIDSGSTTSIPSITTPNT